MPVKSLTPEALRKYIRDHHESTYRLVDVRQPGEYENAHLPGAQLIPLPRLVRMLDSLPADKDVIFYCHSGGRSAAAAVMADEEVQGDACYYNLTGGIMAWNGAMLEDYPQIRLFSDVQATEMMRTAMNLEKGAMRFYLAVKEKFKEQSRASLFDHMSRAEARHAETVYRLLQRGQGDGGAFASVFENLDGEVLEGGWRLQSALEALDADTRLAFTAAIELALKIEYAAYDLYRSVAGMPELFEDRQAFITLAQAEKGHMQMLIDALPGGNR